MLINWNSSVGENCPFSIFVSMLSQRYLFYSMVYNLILSSFNHWIVLLYGFQFALCLLTSSNLFKKALSVFWHLNLCPDSLYCPCCGPGISHFSVSSGSFSWKNGFRNQDLDVRCADCHGCQWTELEICVWILIHAYLFISISFRLCVC